MNALHDVQVLAFDIFGTVVDWRGSIAREIDALSIGVAGTAFADNWRGRYQPAMEAVRSGARPWAKLDVLHRENLEATLAALGGGDTLDEPARQHLNRVWHRLAPWPDVVDGLARLRSRYLLTPLSNGNVGLLTRLARHAGLPFDCILSAETFKAYKPQPAAYLGVADTFDLDPSQVMMVAAHASDLRAAAACGLRTAFVLRADEFGPGRAVDGPTASDRFDLVTTGFDDLARQLGC